MEGNSPPSEETGTILFVDDEPAIRRLYLTYLSSEGFDIDGAPSIAEAKTALKQREYELLIVDKNLTDGSGLDLLRMCREEYPDLEIIVLTGYPSMDSVIEALRYGAFDYLIKPVRDLELLKAKAKRAMERRRLRLENRSLMSGKAGPVNAAEGEKNRKLKNQIARMRQKLSGAREHIINGNTDEGTAELESCLILVEDLNSLID